MEKSLVHSICCSFEDGHKVQSQFTSHPRMLIMNLREIIVFWYVRRKFYKKNRIMILKMFTSGK